MNDDNLQIFEDEDWDVTVRAKDTPAASAIGGAETEKKPAPVAQSRIDAVSKKEERDRIAQANKKKLLRVGIACGVFLLLFIIISILLGSMLSSNRVYEGVLLNGQSVAGLTRPQLSEYIEKHYQAPVPGSKVQVELDSQTHTYDMDTLLSLQDPEKVADEIYGVYRSGSLITRLFGIFDLKKNPRNFELSYDVRPEPFAELQSFTASSRYTTKVEPTYTIEEDRIVFTYGRNGLEITEDGLREAFSQFTASLSQRFGEEETAPGGIYSLPVNPKKTSFLKIQKITVLNELSSDCADASYRKVSSKTLEIVPEIVGTMVDEAELDAVLAKINSGADTDRTEEVLNLYPAELLYTKAFYSSVLFRDSLGSYSSRIRADEMTTEDHDDMAENVRLAAEALNNYVLMPGETFSFLKALDDPEKAGYIEAYEDFGGFDQKVLGGGISQVASALYGAIAKAGLTATTHRHYDYIPNFGIAGLDAYVNFNSQIDFKFRNDFSFPIRIAASVAENAVRVAIRGTVYRETDFPTLDPEEIPVVLQPERTAELSSEIVSRKNYTTTEIQDPNVPAGERVTRVSGVTGYTVNLYLTTTVEEYEQKNLLEQVTYKSRNEQIAVGEGTEPHGEE